MYYYRRCIGVQFALYEIKIVLGTMLAACDFELAQRVRARAVRRALIFWPEGGTRVRIRRRSRDASCARRIAAE